MDWYPLRLTTPVMTHAFGGTAIAERLGRPSEVPGPVAETWEVSDVDGAVGEVLDGPLAGRTLRDLAEEFPVELMGPGRQGARFPVLTKFIDASEPLPVHLHADDETAHRLESEPNGKTEAWHVVDAPPGATALAGTLPGVDAETLRAALLAEDFDAVLRRLPVRPGETLYVPGGTLHSFGPDTLVYEIEQTSDVQQSAVCWRQEDGALLDEGIWQDNIDLVIAEWEPWHRPDFQPGLAVRPSRDVERTFCAAGPHFALERWTAATGAVARHEFRSAVVFTNVGGPVEVRSGGWTDVLGPGRTLLLPAALGAVEFTGPADVLLGYKPDLDAEVRAPLAAAGHSPDVIATLGDL
ncbi:type I phosphomannose isomerase catalytic subunit [Actinomadura rayongensis]|uniref:Mannose-6-phosphate isomerase n=1 Tax=Actinomadura rayongensis TaxID=1429076 RepID=A0A6I4WB62_9ACTN|nr:type I phosphomannose isomerase catalytic subunit [Actinomadura rayongensis]MXQ66020.1 mannose-6-phosphate isomerase [Actinomadura rayongensis]